MAEFLKKNPIALRHCLLYIFLHGESIEEPFDEFCKTIGPDVIRKEEFKHCFDQFEQGKFDDNKQPIADMKDVLQSDKNALRACILYESFKYKHADLKKNNKFIHHPVFSVYMHFCKVIGEDVMEYREFDFWFHRFANGMFDLEFERDKNKKIHELSDMPLDVMENIVEYLDIVDRLSLERTSQSLRLFSQDQKVFHPYLGLDVHHVSVCISFGKEYRIHYMNEGDHAVVTYGGRVRVVFRGASYLKKAFRDFKKILENPKLYVNTLIISSWGKNFDLLEEHIEDALKFTHLLHVKHINFRTQSMKALLNILPSLKPGHLTTITINTDSEKVAIEEIIEMEQWKQAKHLNMSISRLIGPLRRLYHFHEFTVSYWNFSEEDAREMKEILLKSSEFKKCYLYLPNFVNPVAIMQVFGGPIKRRREMRSQYHYPISNSTEYFEIIVCYDVIKIERKKK